jgi:CheY-like chemotaxis protein
MIIALSLKLELTRAGFEVCAIATRGEEAVSLALELKPRVVLMDIRLAGEMDGLTAAQAIRAATDIPIIFISGYLDEANQARAMQLKPLACLNKPVPIHRLKVALDALPC